MPEISTIPAGVSQFNSSRKMNCGSVPNKVERQDFAGVPFAGIRFPADTVVEPALEFFTGNTHKVREEYQERASSRTTLNLSRLQTFESARE